ncbi:PopZ family protein [Phreatobacter sp.]|uniref:PopZ family protein n=1 Tax=Phreatobacter sp. TaxID=1966341 RepID=UPI003F70407B
MSQTAKASEPSMEEILASIRRIIADDEPAKPAAKPAAAPAPVADEAPKSQDDIDALLAGFDDIPEEEPAPPPPPPPAARPPARVEPEILELSTADAVQDHVGIIRPMSQRADIDFMDSPMPAPAPVPAPRPVVAEGPALLSAEAHAAVGAAFGSLANTMFAGGSKTIDDVVKEMLRPMLKTWLDDNLPQLVERLVRAEIERVSRGGGSGR